MSGSRILNCPPPEDCPWLVYTHISNKRSIKRNHRRSTQRNDKRFTQTFYSLSEDHCYRRSIPDMNGKYIFPCSQGWLLMLDMDYESDDCFLLNPVSMEKIQLPPWTGMSMHVCNLTRPPSDPNCMVVAFTGHEAYLRFCRPGDKTWADKKLVLPDEEYYYGGFPVACEGKLYCFPRLSDELMVLEFDGSTSSVDIRPVGAEELPEPTLPERFGHSRCLVESCSELFAVDICYTGLNDKSSIRHIEVFRLNMEDLSWTTVDSLGDRAFFIDGKRCTTSCSAAEESGIKGNSIYVLEVQDKHLYRFDLEDTSLVVTQPIPKRIKNWENAHWIMPNN